MPYEEYDKLAWGLVKDEIRRLIKPRGQGMTTEDVVARILRPNQTSYYFNKGALGDKSLRAVRKAVRHALHERLNSFGTDSWRARLDEDSGMVDIESCYFWEVAELGVTDTNGLNPYRRERFLELKHLNYSIGKRRLCADLMSCFLIVNEHTLYRLIQRGATNREPLAMMGEDVNQWVNLAAMFMLSHKFLGNNIGNNVFIPYRGGALLGKMAFTEVNMLPQGFGRHRIRFKDSLSRGGKVDGAPHEGLLDAQYEGKEGSTTLQISTWIPEEYFHTEQWWAKFRIEEFAKQFKDILDFCVNALHSSNRTAPDERSDLMTRSAEDFGHALGKIFADRRWAIACQW